jgi:uncharacterized membrane protein
VFFAIENGRSSFTHGTWTEAAQKRRQTIEDARRTAEEARDKAAKAQRATAPEKSENAPKKKKRPLSDVEDEIMRLESKKEELHGALGDPALYGDADRREVRARRLGGCRTAPCGSQR